MPPTLEYSETSEDLEYFNRSTDDPKRLHQEIRKSRARDEVQTNWPRIVQRQIDLLVQSRQPTKLFQKFLPAETFEYPPSIRHSQADLPAFLDQAIELERREFTDQALDIVYDAMNDLMLRNCFDEIDRLFNVSSH